MADQKLTQLTALASLSADDLFYVVDDPAGAALSRKMPASVLDAKYLQAANNLSDLANVATARTNLGLVAGGAGDIWVEKAGDIMTGALNINVPTATVISLTLKSTDDSATNPLIRGLASNGTTVNWDISPGGIFKSTGGLSLPGIDGSGYSASKIKLVNSSEDYGVNSMYIQNKNPIGYSEIVVIADTGTSGYQGVMGVAGAGTDDGFQNSVYFYAGDQLGGIRFSSYKSTGYVRFDVGGFDNEVFRVDSDATAGNTRAKIYDNDNGQMERISVGAANSGGAGFKLLRIAN